MLSIDAKGTAIWRDVPTWQAGRTFSVRLSGRANSGRLDVSPDGRLLAFAARGALQWLSAETGELLKTTPEAHMFGPAQVGFSSNGLQVASTSGSYGTVALWDASSFRLVDAFKGHLLGARGPAFSPDGRRLATCGANLDGIRIWDLSTRRELITLSGPGTVLTFAVFSPDGNMLASCGNNDGNLHLWRAPSWEEIEAEEKRLKSGQSP